MGRTPRSRIRLAVALSWPIGLILGAGSPASDDEAPDPEDLRPGLIAAFETAAEAPGLGRARVVRVVPAVVEDWGGGAPDPRIDPSRFTTSWAGWLLIREPGPHRFRLNTGGHARLGVAGRTILEGKDEAVRSEPIDLRPGLVSLRIDSGHGQGQSRLVLDWEGPGFGPEHVPPHLLYHEAALAPPEDRFELGRRLADRLGCASCHPVLDLPAHPRLGPPLDTSADLRPEWLEAWLVAPPASRPGTPMPGFGLDRSQAADLATFLASVSRDLPAPDSEGRMALNVADPGRGQLLFRSAGCLGCHSRGDIEADPAVRIAPDLGDLGTKRSREGVASFLGGSRRNDQGRHRPALGLSTDAAAYLAAYLTSPAAEPAPNDGEGPIAGDPGRGRVLAGSLGCVSCHELPGAGPPRKGPALGHTADPNAGCLSDAPAALVPRFGLSDLERDHLRSFVSGLPERPSPLPTATLADDRIRLRNCLGCHARHGEGGTLLGSRLAEALVEDRELNSLKGTLTPPDLSSVGAKLNPDFLDLAVRGEAPVARPWLSVRMPRYAFDPGEAEAIVDHLRHTDRVADAPADDHPSPARGEPSGITLLGRDGFGCISCHVIGGRIPPGGEAETLGPDLALAHRRMSRPYYDRWLKDPQRIIPGTPMPQFLVPAPGVDGSLDDQLGAVWDALGDARLAELTSTASRQVLERTRDRDQVVLDMIIVPDSPSTYYPRGLFIGLRDDHSLLFDTDRLGWVGWWDRGSLSRTKQGRLWEWHPDGTPIWVADASLPPVVFRDQGGAIRLPRESRERFGTFAELVNEADGVRLRYLLNGPDGGAIAVIEHLSSTPDGWRRRVEVLDGPTGYEALVVAASGTLVDASTPGVGGANGASIRVEGEQDRPFIATEIGPTRSRVLLVPALPDASGRREVRLRVVLSRSDPE